MNKRPHDNGGFLPHKKHKQNGTSSHQHQQRKPDQALRARPGTHETASLPESRARKAEVPAFVPFTPGTKFPDLPQISGELANLPFQHKSSHGYDRSTTQTDQSYERLEFLGDAYIELLASRLIYHHFPRLTAGNQSQMREQLVKNETLAEYARAYGFDQRIQLGDRDRLLKEAKQRGNKGLNKILGDSFEAYVAALIQSDPENGFGIAEKWLTALWTSKAIDAAKACGDLTASLGMTDSTNPLHNYNPAAKSELQQKIGQLDVKLEYESWKASEELKGDKLGQNRHYIALYLTGYGHSRKLLGKGEGKNKVEAGNWAANNAMHGECKLVVQECTTQRAAQREAKKKERDEQMKVDTAVSQA